MNVFVVLLSLTFTSLTAAKPCSEARTQCALNSTCYNSYLAFIESCGRAIVTASPTACTANCSQNLQMLSTTKLSSEMLNCTCNQTDAVCLREKTNFAAACLGGPPPPSSKCITAQTRCSSNSSCMALMTASVQSCALALFPSRSAHCTKKCRKDMAKFTSTPLGRDVANCSCDDGDDRCRKAKVNFTIDCVAGPVTPVSPASSCQGAKEECSRNPSCVASMTAFTNSCALFFVSSSLSKCTEDCRKNVAMLASIPIGRTLMNCSCERPETTPCTKDAPTTNGDVATPTSGEGKAPKDAPTTNGDVATLTSGEGKAPKNAPTINGVVATPTSGEGTCTAQWRGLLALLFLTIMNVVGY